MKRPTRWLLLLALTAAACGKKSEPAKPDARDAAPEASSPAPEAPAAPAEPKAVLLNVLPRWVVIDSKPMVEIMLIGERLAEKPTVTSASPLITIEKIETDATKTSVFASFAPGTPPGDYEFQYSAPGQDPIPFKVHYKAPK